MIEMPRAWRRPSTLFPMKRRTMLLKRLEQITPLKNTMMSWLMNGKTSLFPRATRQRITDQLISQQAAYLSTDPGQP